MTEHGRLATERWFALVAAAVLIAVVGTGIAAATTADDGGDSVEGWTPDVPDVHDAAPPDEPGIATVGDEEFDSLQSAVDAAESGDTVVLEGQFDEHVTVRTPDVTLEAPSEHGAMLDGGGEGTVLTLEAENVTVDGVWIRNSGYDRSDEHAGVHVNGSDSTLSNVRITSVTYGVWIGTADDVIVENSTVVGREDVGEPQRGNGIHLDRADGAELRNNHVTTARDGIYFSWSDGVVAEGNVFWDLRYGVHYMYSDDNRLVDNVAFDNDVGFALMVSENITVANNTAVNNRGPSGQGILIKDVDDTDVRDNAVVANRNGLYVYNAHGNELRDNLILENEVGIHFTAGSSKTPVVGNSFVHNDRQALASTNSRIDWNGTDRGNYWSDARAVDLDGDGTSEVRHRPAGAAERIAHEQPQAKAFAESPAFEAVQLAESSFPVVEVEGVVDHRPLAEPPHENWREYYADHDQ